MDTSFDILLGKTIKAIEVSYEQDEIIFRCNDGTTYKMHHDRDCCESVTIEDIVGDINDLLNSPITMAQEESNSEDPKSEQFAESFTWTFYKLATVKGYVTIRWYGESNGYYSESVSFKEIIHNL